MRGSIHPDDTGDNWRIIDSPGTGLLKNHVVNAGDFFRLKELNSYCMHLDVAAPTQLGICILTSRGLVAVV